MRYPNCLPWASARSVTRERPRRPRSNQMGLFGSDKPAPQRQPAQPQGVDEQAIARYQYMLRTAPPETIEQAHAEAFAQLTPEQRRLVLQKIAEGMPASERALAEQSRSEEHTSELQSLRHLVC